MSNRCPECNKWATLETQDPEPGELDVTDDGVVTGSYRIVRNCADCSTEMKEAQLECEAQVEDLCECKDKELEVNEDSVELLEEGGGRYAKSYYGVTAQVTVTCGKCKKTWDVELTDKVPASGMDELN